MKHLKPLICLFFLLMAVPVGYFIFQTYDGLAREEIARLRFFGEAIFDDIEDELMRMVHEEEARFVDAYNPVFLPPGADERERAPVPSPLAGAPPQDYILGYLQNNPDGSFHTPLTATGKAIPDHFVPVFEELQTINAAFNQRRAESSKPSFPLVRRKAPKEALKEELSGRAGFEEPYIDRSQKKAAAPPSPQQTKRIEKITVGQAQRLSRQSSAQWPAGEQDQVPGEESRARPPVSETESALSGSYLSDRDITSEADQEPAAARTFQVEITPLQSVLISNDRVFMFRRVEIGRQIYRQGFVIKLDSLAHHLAETHFREHPIAQYANLRLDAVSQEGFFTVADAGIVVGEPLFSLERVFPFPFDFLSAELNCSMVPRLASRRTLDAMVLLVIVIFALGFAAIFQSARTVIDLSERRSRFVASVSHELKTPLTNIRMYIEMLEQGIAENPQREQQYFNVLNAESYRLSRLITNVLELSRLDSRQRRIHLQQGHIQAVFEEIETLMGEKVRQAGFSLSFDNQCQHPFEFDPEIMMLILTNLIENSLKFGAGGQMKTIDVKAWQDKAATFIAVADTGPGIPRQHLKKIFNDFYRVEGALTQKTRGTGIGLALVRKFTRLMNGKVQARNNDGPGCTITLAFPNRN